jgi:hypothetical protein
MTFNSIPAFLAHLERVRRELEILPLAIVSKAAVMVSHEAKDYIGTYNATPRWPELAESTKKDREKKGYPANEPLLRTGELKDSITWEAHATSHGAEACVGSDDQKAVWQELGTSRIPPRPFLTTAARAMEKPIHKLAGRLAVGTLVADHAISRELRELVELWRLAKDVAHEVKKDFDDNEKGR